MEFPISIKRSAFQLELARLAANWVPDRSPADTKCSPDRTNPPVDQEHCLFGIYPGTHQLDFPEAAAAKIQMQNVAASLDFYRIDNSTYPSSEQGLDALVSEPSGYPEPRKWGPEPYLNKLPEDPWGEPFLYISEGPRHFELISFGADRREGGEGVDADIRFSGL